MKDKISFSTSLLVGYIEMCDEYIANNKGNESLVQYFTGKRDSYQNLLDIFGTD